MHHTSHTIVRCRTMAVAVVAGVCAACAAPQRPSNPDDFESEITFEPSAPAADAASRDPSDGQGRVEQLVQETSDLTRRLNRAIDDHGTAPPWPQVNWNDQPGLRRPSSLVRPSVQATTTRHAPVRTAPVSEAVPGPAPTAADRTGPKRPVVANRQLLLRNLTETIAHGDDAPALKALILATLSVVDDSVQFNPKSIQQLGPRQRQQLSHYQKLLAALRQEASSGDVTLDRDTISAHLERLFDDASTRIVIVRLVRRVSSYGVYEEFVDNRFLAGREHRLIIYVEVANFESEILTNGRYRVHLAQEIELYTDPGGTKIWQQPREEVIDECRNRRRDFFVRQLIKLPANLSVGKYLLKVRVTDLNNATLDERSVPLVVVADQRMVESDSK